MLEKTAEGLIAHAQSLLGSLYMWGTYGKKITDALIDEKVKQYPSRYKDAYIQKLRKHAGTGIRAVDCVGLIKAYMMTETVGGNPVYQAAYDKNVAGMRGVCSATGKLATLPETPGLLLFAGDAHIGIYLGGGQVIEAVGSDCVKITELSKGKWSDWGRLRWIVYQDSSDRQHPWPTTQPFTNTGGKDLPVYADTSLRQRIGTLPAGGKCHTLGEVEGKTLLLYRVTGTTDYKTGFSPSDADEVPPADQPPAPVAKQPPAPVADQPPASATARRPVMQMLSRLWRILTQSN